MKRAAAGKEDPLTALLQALREATQVWLGASMRYRGDDARRLARLAALASAARVPLIATGDVLYHAPERRALQDVMTCIREHVTLATAGRRLEANAERHLKPPEEMARLFRAAPEAVEETLHLLERCKFSLDELKYEYPDETREGYATPQEALVAVTEAGARRRYPDGIPRQGARRPRPRIRADRRRSITRPISSPSTTSSASRARRSILCQGRGSAANSAVCYCLGITEVDPARVDLLFERFVSADRGEPPDIDVDFEHERREEVIQYIYDRYGRHRAGLAATVICYRARSAIREVGKAFGLSEDTVGALAGMLWGWSTQAVSEKDARRVGLDPADPQLARVLALARELIGFPAPSLPACRRLRHHPRPARRGGADRERRDGGAHLRRMGQGRSRRPRHPQDRRPRARHADLPATRLRSAEQALRGALFSAAPSPALLPLPACGERVG